MEVDSPVHLLGCLVRCGVTDYCSFVNSLLLLHFQ